VPKAAAVCAGFTSKALPSAIPPSRLTSTAAKRGLLLPNSAMAQQQQQQQQQEADGLRCAAVLAAGSPWDALGLDRAAGTTRPLLRRAYLT
jgi:hypothetical protein